MRLKENIHRKENKKQTNKQKINEKGQKCATVERDRYTFFCCLLAEMNNIHPSLYETLHIWKDKNTIFLYCILHIQVWVILLHSYV